MQGYELEVFKGATKTLESIDLILAEINKEEMYKDCARVEDLDNYLQGFGFERIFHQTLQATLYLMLPQNLKSNFQNL